MTKKEIGKYIKTARQASASKPIDLFKKHGITSDQLKAVEHGNKKYTVDTLLNVCQFYGVSISLNF